MKKTKWASTALKIHTHNKQSSFASLNTHMNLARHTLLDFQDLCVDLKY